MLGAPEDVAVATEDGVLCGYVCQDANALTVHPAYRRRGHGRRLIAAGMDHHPARGPRRDHALHVPATGAGPEFAAERWALPTGRACGAWTFGPEPLVPGPVLPGRASPPAPFGEVARSLERYVELAQPVLREPSHAAVLDYLRDRVLPQPARFRPVDDPAPDDDRRRAGAARSGSYGFRSLRPRRARSLPIGDVRLVGVMPEWRGRGLGRELLRWAVAELRSRGAGRISLSVEAENELALELYRRTGFEPAIEWPHWGRPVRVRGCCRRRRVGFIR
jgi:mycothiol synthase